MITAPPRDPIYGVAAEALTRLIPSVPGTYQGTDAGAMNGVPTPMGIANGSRKETYKMLTKKEQSHPGVWRLLRIWTLIGLQSFGGGTSTILIIQRNFIDKYHWMTMDEFMHFWNLCLLAPGTNIIALTILIGKKMAGTRGIIVSLTGMLLPSAL